MTKQYFDDQQKKLIKTLMIVDNFYKKAEFYNRLWKITKWDWVKKKNQYYVDEGIKLCVGGFASCIANMAILNEIIKDSGE